MKKQKRFVAMLLALALIVAALAMPAAAASPDEASTYGLVQQIACPRCGFRASLLSINGPTIYMEMRTCSSNSNEHTHAIQRTTLSIDCPFCGNFQDETVKDLGCVTLS